MIVTYPKLEKQGRLGNQLWQIAGTLGLARWNGGEPRFPPSWTYRPYFSIPDQYFSNEIGTPAPDLLKAADPRAREYLQDLSLFEGSSSEVREWFAPSELALAKLKETEVYASMSDAISLHVRRGDYVYQGEYYWLATVEYYKKALALLPQKPIVVFSDDPSWCHHVLREQLGRPMTIYHGVTRPREDEPNYATAQALDWIDLFLQAEAGRHIISNSSYAWWGAWLSGDQYAIYPSKWYGPKITWMNVSAMMPPTWRRVEVA